MRTEEKRRAPRVFHALKAKLEWESGEQEFTSTIDLSSSGVLLDVSRPAKLGQVVSLRFETSPSNFTEASGVVRRSLPAFGGRRHILALSFLEPQTTLYATACAREKNQNSAWSGSRTA